MKIILTPPKITERQKNTSVGGRNGCGVVATDAKDKKILAVVNFREEITRRQNLSLELWLERQALRRSEKKNEELEDFKHF